MHAKVYENMLMDLKFYRESYPKQTDRQMPNGYVRTEYWLRSPIYYVAAWMRSSAQTHTHTHKFENIPPHCGARDCSVIVMKIKINYLLNNRHFILSIYEQNIRDLSFPWTIKNGKYIILKYRIVHTETEK